MGMQVAHHLKIFKPKEEGVRKQLGRKYSPINAINTKGYVDFVIKCYPKTDEFPEGGKMSNYIRTLSVGDTVLCNDPKGKLLYMGDGVFNHKRKGKFRATNIVLLAGGSGITTLYSLLNAIYRAKETHINVKLIYSSKTRADILCKAELDAIANDESCKNI